MCGFFCFQKGGERRLVRVNGKIILDLEGMVLVDFLIREGYDLSRIALERNGDIIPKSQYLNEVIVDGDIYEIVGFVGGG